MGRSVKPAARTCVACRRQGSRAELARFVERDGRVEFDDSKTKPGRGAWLHPECFDSDLSARFSRAFRKSVITGRLVPQVYTESKAESMQTQK